MFDKWFTTSPESGQNDSLKWISLIEIFQLDTLVEKSYQKPQFIFKHSTRCGISRTVKREFEGSFPFKNEEVDLYYLDLLSYRHISNKIASLFGVYHESPQLLIVKNGRVVKHASHGNIIELNYFLVI